MVELSPCGPRNCLAALRRSVAITQFQQRSFLFHYFLLTMSSNRPMRPERKRDHNSATPNRSVVVDNNVPVVRGAATYSATTPVDDDDVATTGVVECMASSSSSSSTPSQRHREALRLESIGVDPSILIGKVLKRVSRSRIHPCLTLEFSDNTTYRVLVDGYDTKHRGVPTVLEMDAMVEPVFNPPDGHISVDLLVQGCTFVRLSDKAFERKSREFYWDQAHLGIAFKFGENSKRWHCVWAMLEERDEQSGLCVFRSFDDVYLQPVVDRREHAPNKIRNSRYGVCGKGKW